MVSQPFDTLTPAVDSWVRLKDGSTGKVTHQTEDGKVGVKFPQRSEVLWVPLGEITIVPSIPRKARPAHHAGKGWDWSKNVCTLRCVEALLGDADTQLAAFKHLVNICANARRFDLYGRFSVQATGTAEGRVWWSRPLTHNLDTSRVYGKAIIPESGKADARDAALAHVADWLAPYQNCKPEEIYQAAADGAFRFIAARFADRYSNHYRDELNRRRLVRWLYPEDPSARAKFGEQDGKAPKAEEIFDMLSDQPDVPRQIGLWIDLRRALAQLPETQARAWIAVKLDCVSPEAYAQGIGITRAAVDSLVHRANRQLSYDMKPWAKEILWKIRHRPRG